jgi:P2-related tail formation protein
MVENELERVEGTTKPVREVTDPSELMEKAEEQELVGVADNAIIFRSEIIVTDPDIKEQLGKSLQERVDDKMGSAVDNLLPGGGDE